MELKRSNFLNVLESLELEDDINLIKDYFSYEHFYVIYCKFWELDKDHDLLISKEDLYRHNNYGNDFLFVLLIFKTFYFLYEFSSL
jgi:serine/threonine-protein phosphatase 2A regulatory subunit B''